MINRMSTLSGSKVLEATFSTKMKNMLNMRLPMILLSFITSPSSKVEMVSNISQNLPLIEASSIHATRELNVSSITYEDKPPLGVILTSALLCDTSPVTLASIKSQRTAESPLVSAAKSQNERTDKGICISIPVFPLPSCLGR